MSFLINPYRFAAATAYDTDAQAYITAVETADGQALETGVKDAINAFVVGCKADGIWTAIKASCILAGARTLSGALVPLAGTAPTNVNFVAGDYDRKTGLVGNGTSKYLDSNRANNADPQNSNHNACWVSSTANGVLMASSAGNTTGTNYLDIAVSGTTTRFGNRHSTVTSVSGTALPGLYGHSRATSASYIRRTPQSGSTTQNTASQVPNSLNVYLYVRTDNGTTFSAYYPGRIAFYSIGESLDLALLDSRVTTLINALAAAIP